MNNQEILIDIDTIKWLKDYKNLNITELIFYMMTCPSYYGVWSPEEKVIDCKWHVQCARDAYDACINNLQIASCVDDNGKFDCFKGLELDFFRKTFSIKEFKKEFKMMMFNGLIANVVETFDNQIVMNRMYATEAMDLMIDRYIMQTEPS